LQLILSCSSWGMEPEEGECPPMEAITREDWWKLRLRTPVYVQQWFIKFSHKLCVWESNQINNPNPIYSYSLHVSVNSKDSICLKNQGNLSSAHWKTVDPPHRMLKSVFHQTTHAWAQCSYH
jgi:hypothetical protein